MPNLQKIYRQILDDILEHQVTREGTIERIEEVSNEFGYYNYDNDSTGQEFLNYVQKHYPQFLEVNEKIN